MLKLAQPLFVASALALLAACSSPAPGPTAMAPMAPPTPMAAPAPPMEEPYVAPRTAPRRHVARSTKAKKKVVHRKRHRAATPATAAPAAMAPAPMAPMAPANPPMPGPRPSGR